MTSWRRRSVFALLAVSLCTSMLVVGTPAMAIPGTSDSSMTHSVARVTYNGTPECTGTVIADGWVMTARHCVWLNGKRMATASLGVQLWKSGMSTSELYTSVADQVKVMDAGDPGKQNPITKDVALLHLKNVMPGWVKTVPIAQSWPGLGTQLTQFGYGYPNGKPPMASSLMKSYQGSITRIACPTVSGVSWVSSIICESPGKSPGWGGDSGGPLLWWNSGYWQQVGTFTGFYPAAKTFRFFTAPQDAGIRAWIESTTGVNVLMKPGSILRDQSSGAAWQYQSDGYRHWISNGGTYQCLQSQNGNVVINRPLRTVEAVPDKVGSQATCTPPAPVLHAEQQGSHGANTFTNPHNASGTGARVNAMAWVSVSCKVYAPEIASVNPDGYWYRLSDAPWNGQYYVAANTFWNGDVPRQLPYTHNTDWVVPNC